MYASSGVLGVAPTVIALFAITGGVLYAGTVALLAV